jgi:ABC-type sugar transport system substrate-binding protein
VRHGRRPRALAFGGVLLAVVAAVVGYGIVAGIGGNDERGADANRADGDTAVAGFVQAGESGGWRAANTRDIHQAFDNAEIDLVYANGEGSQENQIAEIRGLIAQHVDVIVVAPVVESGWDAVLSEAQAAGIAVVLTEREVDTPRDTLWDSFVGSDFTAQGERAGTWVVDRFREADLLRIAELYGTAGTTVANDRAKGFRDAISGELSFEFVDSQSGDFSWEGGRAAMDEMLRAQPEIDLVFAHNDEMALGAIDAIRSWGIAPGRDITIVSIDGTASGLAALAEGEISFIVESSPLVGAQLVDVVTRLATGDDVPRTVHTEETTFTREQAGEALPDRQY